MSVFERSRSLLLVALMMVFPLVCVAADEANYDDDTPSYQFRIRLLTHVSEHPEIYNKMNGKIIKSLQEEKLREIKKRQAP